MIRLIQRRLIIPRGDTGSFSIPVLSKGGTDNIAVFTIFDETTRTKMFQKIISGEGDVLTIAFTHSDTVNLKPGKYVWDIKYYKNPEYIDNELVNGEEIDSYYAGFSLPVCEIRETADNYLVSPEAPTATLSPEQLEIVTGAIHSLNEAIRKTQENVEHYPEIRDEVWHVWDAELGDYVSTDVQANGIVGNGIASAVLNNDYTLTLNFTDGTSFTSPSIRGQKGNGIDDIVLNNNFTLTISYTDGGSYTTPSIRGPIGPTPQFSIGTVQDGAVAAASVTGTAENPVLNLTLPNAHVPTRVSQLENDAGYLTQHQDLSDYVQKTDYATGNDAGVVKIDSSYGIQISSNGYLQTTAPSTSQIKSANKIAGTYRPIVPSVQHISAFYGLAKAAGDNTQSASNNEVGVYTSEAKAAIQQMLDVPSTSDIPTQVSELINDAGYLTTETDPTVPAWAKAAQKPTYTASEVGAPTVAEMNTAIGTAIGNINSFDMAIVQTLPAQDISIHTIYLVPKTGETNDIYDEYVYINNNWEMVGNTQIDLSNYALKSELPDVPVQDVQIDGSSIVNSGVASIPKAGASLGLIRINSERGINISDGLIFVNKASTNNIKIGTDRFSPIVPSNQHESTFYGLAKAAGDSTQSASANAVGIYTDEAKAAIQQMLDVPSTNDIPIESGTGVGSVKTKDFEYNNTLYSNVASGYGSVAIGLNTTANGGGSFAEGTETIAESSAHAEGISTYAKTYGHSEGRWTYAQGVAHAEGQQSEALDIISHVEGMMTITANRYAHAEGSMSVAAGHSSHAEGYHLRQTILLSGEANATQYTYSSTQGATIEVGNMILCSHIIATVTAVENNVITVNTSFKEALTSETAYLYTDYAGNSSHIEGAKTHAPTSYAHAQGYNTVAIGAISDVSGQYNIKDTMFPNWTASTLYQVGDKVRFEETGLECIEANSDATFTIAHWKIVNYTSPNAVIVGNGTSSSARSNAYALDWDGNGHYMGDVYVGANADSSGGTKLAKITDIPEVPVQDVQVNGVSVLDAQGTANVPIIQNSNGTTGVVRVAAGYGVSTDGIGTLSVTRSPDSVVKVGSEPYRPITPVNQHLATFYGLSKVAGVDLANETVTLGTYPETSKTAIKAMLGVQDGLKVVRLI